MRIDHERLRLVRKRRGLTQAQLGKASGFNKNYISQIERAPKTGNIVTRPDTIIRLAEALDVPPEQIVVFSGGQAVAADRLVLRATEGLLNHARTPADGLGSHSVGSTADDRDGPPVGFDGDLLIEFDLETVAHLGVMLERRRQTEPAAQMLSHVVGPKQGERLLKAARSTQSPKALLAAAVASAHYGQIHHDRHHAAIAIRYFKQALHLLEECRENRSPSLTRLWDEWRSVTYSSPRDFQLWCVQMLGVAKRMSGGKGNLREATGYLLYTAQQMSPTKDTDNLACGNVLRDLATTRIAIQIQSEQAKLELDESVARLSDTEEFGMLAMSLVKRAAWYKSTSDVRRMELDAVASLALPSQGNSLVTANLLNSVAELYEDIEPNLAKKLVRRASQLAEVGGFNGQKSRSDSIERRLTP